MQAISSWKLSSCEVNVAANCPCRLMTAGLRLMSILLLLVAKSNQDQTELHQQASQPKLITDISSTSKPLFQDAGRGGIAHIRLASERLGVHPESVMLHIFLRAIQPDTRLLIKGFGFVEPIDEIKMDMMHLTQPYTIRDWHPDISLISMVDQKRHPFVVDLTQTRKDPWRPFHLEISLPASAANMAFQLHVDDWIRYGFYYPKAHTIARPVHQPFTYSMVFSTFFRDQREAMIDLMLKHMDYHNALGFSTHHVYVHGDYLSPLLDNSKVLACIQAGSLELIYWDVFGGYSTPVWEYADQAIMYNHALLMLWGESRRLAFLDVDEYLATPKKTTIGQLYESCFHSGQLQVLRRFDALCSTCTAGTNELSVWHSNDVRLALSHYTLLRLDTGGLSP